MDVSGWAKDVVSEVGEVLEEVLLRMWWVGSVLFREGLWGVKAGREGTQEVGGVPEGGLYILLYRLFILLNFSGIVFVHECAFLVITSTVAHSL